jgi:predicted GNAT family N-acyltransferase
VIHHFYGASAKTCANPLNVLEKILMKSCYHILLSPAKTAILDNCDYYGLGRIITRINVPEGFRGKSVGTNLLTQIMKDADEEGVRLFLEISPSGGLSAEQLQDWYQRHGFFSWLGIYRRNPKVSNGTRIKPAPAPTEVE